MVEPYPMSLMKGTQVKHSLIIEGYIVQKFKKNTYLKDNTLGLGC